MAQTFLGSTLLSAWAQVEAKVRSQGCWLDITKTLEALRQVDKLPGGVTGSRFCPPKQVLDSFRVKKLCQPLRAASPWRSREVCPHAWGMVRASSSHGSDNPAGRPRFTGMRQDQGQAEEPVESITAVELRQVQQLREELETPA